MAATATDLLVSKDPTAGASSWQIIHNADSATGPECGKYGPGEDCAVAMDLLSCGSPTSCTAVDNFGGTLSGDPVTGAWTSSSGAGFQIDGAACLSNGTCLTECGVGAGFAGAECTGNVYEATDLCGGPKGCFTISHQELSGLWCPTVALCFATGPEGDLIASTRPTAGTSAWTTAYLKPRPAANIDQAITGLSCPTSSLCVAVNAVGGLLLGSPLPTATQIKRLLGKDLSLTRAQARPTTLLKDDGCSRTFSSPSAGRLRITLTAVGTARPRSRTVIATGAGTFKSSGTIKIKLVLSKAGRRRLRTTRSLRVEDSARLTGAGSPPIAASRTLSLK